MAGNCGKPIIVSSVFHGAESSIPAPIAWPCPDGGRCQRMGDGVRMGDGGWGTVSDFVLGFYVLCCKPKTKSDTTQTLMRVGHLLHERGKIAISLGPNDKMPMVGHQTVSAQPHLASSQRFLNDPLERQKVLVFGEKQSPAHASVEHVENHPPRRMSPRS